MPRPHLPQFDLVLNLLPYAISISIVVAAIHISLAKMYSKKFGYKTDSGQEFYALSFTAFLSSFFPLYPICCSLGRTVVNVDAGTKTQFSSVFSSAIIALLIFYLGPFLRTLPMSILAVIIMVALTGMFRKASELKYLWPVSKYDFFIWVVSYIATVAWDVTPGLGVALAVALMTTVFRTQWPKWHYLVQLKGTNEYNARYTHTNDMNVSLISIFTPIIFTLHYTERKRFLFLTFQGICIFRFDAPLLFTNVEHFKECIDQALSQWKIRNTQLLGPHDLKIKVIGGKVNPIEVINKNLTEEEKDKIDHLDTNKVNDLAFRHFVIDCSGFAFVDVMGVNAIKEVYHELKMKKCLVYFAGAKSSVLDLFESCGMFKYVAKSNFYPTVHDAVEYAKKRRSKAAFYLLDTMDVHYDPIEDSLSMHAVT